MKKLISDIVLAINLALILWVIISTLEVWSKNLKPNPEYSQFNCYSIFIEMCEGDDTNELA